MSNSDLVKESIDVVVARSNMTRRQFLIWLSEQRHPDDPIYNTPFTWIIRGPIVVPRFVNAFECIVASSDALRSTIVDVNGNDVLQIVPFSKISPVVEVIDYSNREDPDGDFITWCKDRARRTFQKHFQLFDCVLIKINSAKFAWFLNAHHIITDGRSTQLIFQSVADFYSADKMINTSLVQSSPDHSSAIKFEFETRNTKRHIRAEKFWNNHEKELPPASDYKLSNNQRSSRGVQIKFDIAPEFTNKINDQLTSNLSRSCFFAAIFSVWQYAIKNTSEPTLGITIENRLSKETQNTFGLHMNMVPLSVKIESNDTFEAITVRIQASLMKMMQHSNYTSVSLAAENTPDYFFNYLPTKFTNFTGFAVQTKWIYPGHQESAVVLHVYDFDDSNIITLDFRVREDCLIWSQFQKIQPSLESLLVQVLENRHIRIEEIDLIRLHRTWLDGAQMGVQVAYWREHLSGAPELLALPTDHPRPAVQSFHGGAEYFRLSSELTKKLTDLSKDSSVTLFTTLLSAFSVLLSRYANQQDIVIGSPIANRARVEQEPLIGGFVNTLVLRTDLSGDISFNDLLQQVLETTLLAHQHQDVPFEKLVEELQPTRSLSYSPVFQVLFVLLNTPVDGLPLDELTAEQICLNGQEGQGVEKFDLTLKLVETHDGLKGRLNYNTDLFEADTIERMAGHFEVLLKGIVADPETKVSRLPLLTEVERHQLLVEWNDTATAYPSNKCIHQLFEEQVERTPDAIAVMFEDHQLTYTELNSRSNQLAHYLIAYGVGPEQLVGICFERSVHLVVGLLGILKAGGAYLPVDPAYPKDRISYMLKDASPVMVLTQSGILPDALECTAELVELDSQWPAIAKHTDGNPDPNKSGLTSNHLAYVIYTSGSTGQPKGVMNEHRGISNYLHYRQRMYCLSESDTVLQKTPFSFDVSVWEIFWPLMSGARLVVASPGGHQDLDYLSELIEKVSVTTIHFVPSMLSVFLDYANLAACSSLRHISCSGGVLSVELQQRCLQLLPHSKLHNLYGPTEAAVDVTSEQCFPDHAATIGRPISNTSIYVLDQQDQPVPVGVAGEIYIGGANVARGYYNNLELSAEKFIQDRFCEDPAARLYKTGDLGRWLSDGRIEYLGRNDFQVKIRGFRVELGEIESVLRSYSGVSDVVVVMAGEETDHLFVAYLVCVDGLSTTQLRDFVSTQLPDYMVPSIFTRLDAIPLTANGKVDRRALPLPDIQQLTSAGYVAAQTETEVVLTSIWSELLVVGQIGIHDNFFELGGHSLMVMQIVSRIRAAFGFEVSIGTIFEHPTIELLAKEMEHLKLDIENKQSAYGNVDPDEILL